MARLCRELEHYLFFIEWRPANVALRSRLLASTVTLLPLEFSHSYVLLFFLKFHALLRYLLPYYCTSFSLCLMFKIMQEEKLVQPVAPLWMIPI